MRSKWFRGGLTATVRTSRVTVLGNGDRVPHDCIDPTGPLQRNSLQRQQMSTALSIDSIQNRQHGRRDHLSGPLRTADYGASHAAHLATATITRKGGAPCAAVPSDRVLNDRVVNDRVLAWIELDSLLGRGWQLGRGSQETDPSGVASGRGGCSGASKCPRRANSDCGRIGQRLHGVKAGSPKRGEDTISEAE